LPGDFPSQIVQLKGFPRWVRRPNGALDVSVSPIEARKKVKWFTPTLDEVWCNTAFPTRLSQMEEEAMVRLAIVISVFALLACGGSETSQTGDAGDAAPASAAVEEKAAAPPTPQAAAVADAKVKSCIQLIRESMFERALVVCAAALEIDPDNQEVKDALNTASAEAAKAAVAPEAAGAAAEGAAEGAAEDATSKLGEAAGGMPEMGQ